MRISDLVAQYIINMLEENDGDAEIRRNELAETIGCVPSQINYVITSRFTPEQAEGDTSGLLVYKWIIVQQSCI